MLKRKKHIHEKLYTLILYTLITFVIGLILKIVLVAHLFDQSRAISDSKEKLTNLQTLWHTSGHRPDALDHTKWSYIQNESQFSDAMDTFSRQQKEQKTALILQFAIVLVTLIIYSRSLWDMYKMNKDTNQTFTNKRYKAFMIEYIIFLSLFIAIDSYALYLVFKENPKMDSWIIYSLVSLFIPTVMAIGSLVLVKRTKSLI